MCLPFCKGEMLDINGNTDLYQCVQHIGTALKCAEDGHSKSMSQLKGIYSFLASGDFCHMLRIFANTLDPDRDPKSLTL